VLHFGLGYPLLKNYAYGPPQELDFWVGATFPDGYQFISSDPLPDRVVGGQPVWHITGSSSDSSYHDQVVLEVEIPAGPTLADIYAWATSDPRAATVNPPSGTERDRLYEGVWHYRQDLMVQRVLPAEENVPVLKVTKQGPAHASPGDRVDYTVIVLNCGNADAEDVLVTDDWPGEMQVPGPPILGNIDLLEPGDIWGTSTHGVLKWELDDGTEVTNWANAYLVDDPSRKGSGHTTLTIQVAADPNHISVSPTGGVDRKQTLTYTLECENVGAGTAYGVYASVLLSPRLDDFTLSLGEGLSYDPDSRILTWEVGTLLSKQGATTSFSVQVAWNAARARPVVEQAVVYFPSVPEETPTNVVADIVNGSFSDVLWDHWAVLQVELTYENGIVQGYPDGTYRPSNVVDRGQMAVYMARALAGGDAHVPTGPAEPTFSDVLTDHWAYKYVEYAVAEGVVVGYPDGTYRPTQQVTRGQMAVYVARAMVAPAGDEGVPDPPAEPTFLDVTGTSEWVWCYPHVEYVVDEGVVGGYADGTYRPQYTVTRDQMAVYVTRAFRLPM
jgi:uncharacterized repeat protein (TIGR01451 family)